MSERIDRRIRGDRLVVAIIIVLAACASAALYVWSTRDVPVPSSKPGAQERTPPTQPSAADAQRAVTLYYPSGGALTAVQSAVNRQSDTQSQAKAVVAALFADQRAGQAAVLRDVRPTAFYLDSSGTASIDLSTAQQREIRASAEEELAAIYAVVNTLTSNFAEIKQVRFLLNGKEVQTLAGHVDVTSVFHERTDLIRQ